MRIIHNIKYSLIYLTKPGFMLYNMAITQRHKEV